MAGNRSAVAAPQHTMNMKRRLTIGTRREIAYQRCNFDLLGDRDVPVVLLLPVEITQKSGPEGTDCGKLASPQLFAFDEVLQAGHHFVVRPEYDHEGPLSTVAIDHFCLHPELHWFPRENEDGPASVPSKDKKLEGGIAPRLLVISSRLTGR
jgi:hypothetical protein